MNIEYVSSKRVPFLSTSFCFVYISSALGYILWSYVF
jgi:hypothetical protein